MLSNNILYKSSVPKNILSKGMPGQVSDGTPNFMRMERVITIEILIGIEAVPLYVKFVFAVQLAKSAEFQHL